MPNILGSVLDLLSVGEEVASRRKALRLTQAEVSHRARISRATLDAVENGRTGELGFSKLTRLLTVLGLEFRIQAASSQRPTLDDLLEENRNDKSLDRRR